MSFPFHNKIVLIFSFDLLLLAHGYPPNQYHTQTSSMGKCSLKLETALEQMLRKDQSRTGYRSEFDLSSSPYSMDIDNDKSSSITKNGGAQFINEKIDYKSRRRSSSINDNNDENIDDDSGERMLPLRSVNVAELRVRLPQNVQWVRVEKCQFSPKNQTLDTHLIFPDLTISGRIIIQPNNNHCDMILRLRQAGIEFRTTPIIDRFSSASSSRNSRTATVRTDSHFTEPGFISVFAHGCDNTMKFDRNRYRPNSKRKHFVHQRNNNDNYDDYNDNDREQYDNRHQRQMNYNRTPRSQYNDRHQKEYNHDNKINQFIDDIHFDDSLINDDGVYDDYTTKRSYDNNYRNADYDQQSSSSSYRNKWHNIELANTNEINDAYSRELEDLFSQGVRSLLTTYMQKALQPAIKETLMESMGYTLSYG